MNVVLQSRVSSEEQAERDLSIPAQRKELRAFCEREGHHVMAEFVEEGVSAYGPADKRKQFMAMVEYCLSHPVDAVMVVRFDRFSRNQKESIVYKGVLRRKGVRVISISEPIDSSTPAGELHEGMIELINQYYSRLLAVMTRRGLKEAAENGFWPEGKPPLGYRLEKVGEHSRLVVGPEAEVELVREIFRLAHEERRGLVGIVNALAAAGIAPRRGHAWRQSSIHKILVNPIYKGLVVWGSREKVDGKMKKQGDPEKIVFGQAPALVSPDVWDAVRAQMGRRLYTAPAARDGHAHTLLGRLMRCSCGGAYVGRRQRSIRKGEVRYHNCYRCRVRTNNGRLHCQSREISMEETDQVVIGMVRRHLTPQLLEQAEHELLMRWEAEKTQLLAPAALERQLAEFDQQIDRYYRAIGEGLDASICKRLIAEAEAKKADLVRRAESLRAQVDARRMAGERLEEARHLMQVISSDFESLTFDEQRDAVMALVERIDVLENGERLRIVMRPPLKNMERDRSPSSTPLQRSPSHHGANAPFIQRPSRAPARGGEERTPEKLEGSFGYGCGFGGSA